MKFKYHGFDAGGKPAAGAIDAADAREAGESLRRKGIFATEVTPDGVAADPAAARPGKRASRKDVAAFVRQLSVMVATGTPLVDGINSIERQAPPGAWRSILADVRAKVEEGAQLSEAMSRHPTTFDGVCRSLVAAGESGGRLDVLLDRLSKLMRQQIKVQSALTGAMVYPSLLLVIAACVLVAMLTFVLPRFEGLFKTLNAPLPPTTKVLMDASQILREQWMWVIGGAIGLVVSVIAYLRTESGRAAVDMALVRIPQVGTITRSLLTARIARVLGVLLDGRVPLLDALKLTRQSTGNRLYADLIGRAESAVERGESLSAVFGESNLVNTSVVEALRNGERTGQVAPVLVSLADYLDEDNEVAVKTLTGLIEPLILIVLGVVVGTIAISMFLPLFDLTAAGSGGPGGGE